MGANPADIPALQALLAARADAPELFSSGITSTSIRYVPHVLQPVFAPQTQSVALVSWSARYKGTNYGDFFAVDVANQDQALAALLDHALQVFDTVDLRRAAWGLSSPTFLG